MNGIFRGFAFGVFIPKSDLHDKEMAKSHIAWLKSTRGWSEGTDYHWVTCISGPRGMGEEFYFKDADDAVYFKLARGGRDFTQG